MRINGASHEIKPAPRPTPGAAADAYRIVPGYIVRLLRFQPRRLHVRSLAASVCRAALLSLLLAAAPPRAAAQLVEPGRPLYRIRSEHFDLYYPAELSAEADRLAGFADETFDSLALLFPDGARSGKRIPLLLADGFDSLNGFQTGYPSERIVLEAGPSLRGGELGSYGDGLREVFTHELAHALSMRTRGPLWSIAAALFGDAVSPANLVAPLSIIEGAAVLAESAGGLGRLNDPLAASLIAQDIIEGEFKDFWQAAGAWDAYPFGRLPYIYGAFFTSHLIESRGVDAYAEFWRRLGQGQVLPGIEGGLLAKGAFESAYGIGLDDAWDEFRRGMAPEEPVVMSARRLSAEPGYITALAAGASGLYWADAAAGAVLALEPGSDRPRRVFAADGYVERLDLSPDGESLLVSWSRSSGGSKGERLALVVDIQSGDAIGTGSAGLGDAAFAGDALVGIRRIGFGSDLVLERGGESRILLAGGPELSFSSPASLDGETLYCLALDAGVAKVLKIEIDTGRAWALVPSAPLENLRSLAVAPPPAGGSGARLILSYAPEGGFQRLAIADERGGAEALVARQEIALSGSVLMPAAGGAEFLYVGRFSDGEYPCSYPADNPALSLGSAPAAWVELDPDPPRPEAQAESRNAPSRAPALPLILSAYRYLSISPDQRSAGVGLAGEDIASRLAWSLDARYDRIARGADLALDLELGLAPFALGIAASDGFSGSSTDGERRSSASVSLAREWRFLPRRRLLEVEAEASAAALAPAAALAAYASSYEAAAVSTAASIRYSAYRSTFRPPYAGEGAGVDLSLDAEWPLAPAADARPALALEAGADASLPFIGLSASLRAALSPDASVVFGPAGRALRDGAASIREALFGVYREYANLDLAGSFYAAGEISFLPFSFELQKRLALGKARAPLYFERLGLRAGLRAAACGAGIASLGRSELLSSAFGSLILQSAPLLGVYSSGSAHLGLEATWAFRDDLVENQLGLAWLAGWSY